MLASIFTFVPVYAVYIKNLPVSMFHLQEIEKVRHLGPVAFVPPPVTTSANRGCAAFVISFRLGSPFCVLIGFLE